MNVWVVTEGTGEVYESEYRIKVFATRLGAEEYAKGRKETSSLFGLDVTAHELLCTQSKDVHEECRERVVEYLQSASMALVGVDASWVADVQEDIQRAIICTRA